MTFIDVFLYKKDSSPLYYQLYSHLVGEIRCGAIAAGERLPGKRTAAAQLGVSVNTVDEAYQMLAAEGYVESKPRSGFVVNRVEGLLINPIAAKVPLSAPPVAHTPPQQYSFSSGGLDAALFPLKTWNRLLRETLSSADGPALFTRGEGSGDDVLRQALAEYLHSYRGVRCNAGQLVVGAGLEVLTGMLGRLLENHHFAVENPGYPKTMHVLRNMGLPVSPVAVDDEGLCVDALEQSGASVAYVTPSHQFPTGCVMPVGRRIALLRWAAGGERYLIEDDYDSEFRFDGRPLPSLQGLDTAGHVIYAGTFSRSLAPGLRAAYLVLPAQLLQRWNSAYGDYACTVSRPEQHTLARLMDGGHFARGLNRMRSVYRQKRDALAAAIEAVFPAGSWHIENAHTGLYFILRLPGQDAAIVARNARRQGLLVHALNDYLTGAAGWQKAADALVLGYGDLEVAESHAAAARLCAAIWGI